MHLRWVRFHSSMSLRTYSNGSRSRYDRVAWFGWVAFNDFAASKKSRNLTPRCWSRRRSTVGAPCASYRRGSAPPHSGASRDEQEIMMGKAQPLKRVELAALNFLAQSARAAAAAHARIVWRTSP